MSWRDYLSIRLLIELTVITFVIAGLPVSDDGSDRNRELQQSITTESAGGEYLQVDSKKRDTSYEVDGDEDDADEEEDDDESEQTNVNEYEEELRDIAESHEAMSRDDRNNSTDGINPPEMRVFPGETSIGVKNFDSHEKSVEEGSDESMTSNEAISSELEQDTEVEELLKFKREDKQKYKRVPTVKKQLSSQKEIQENSPHVNATTEIVNEFRNENADGGARQVVNNDVLDNVGTRGESQVERRSLRQESGVEYEYPELDAGSLQIVERLDKRHQSGLESHEPYLPLTTQRKLRELETDEYTLAQNLMELLVKLAANPRHWERAHRLLKDVEDDLKLSRSSDSDNRDFENFNRDVDESPHHSLLLREPAPTLKKPKKKKKKKKKPRFQPLTTPTMPALPLTAPTPMTVSAESSTQAHWRVVVDRLFRPSWSSSSNDRTPSNIAKINYVVSSNELESSTSKQHDDNTEYISDDSSAWTDFDRKYPSLRKFHFGKINTHEKGSPLNRQDPIHVSKYESNTPDTSNSRLQSYDPHDQIYQGSNNNGNDRYDQYVGERSRSFSKGYLEDYQVPLDYSVNDFSRHRGYHNKPWKFSKYDMTYTSNPYLDTGRSGWMAKYGPWKNFWRPMIDVENENNDGSRMYAKFGPWSPENNMRDPSWNSVGGISRGHDYSSDVIVNNENKNRSELNATWKYAQDDTDNKGMPKITMKTWNSLTSDPATWPFKLSGVKPWPKDKNGRTFNPNADLVRKLGLDKQGYDRKKDEILQTSNKETLTKINNSLHEEQSKDWIEDRKIWPLRVSSKIQSIGTWVDSSEQSTWKPYELEQRQSIENSEKSRWPEKTIAGTWREKLPDRDVKFGKQSNLTPTWPSKWKQFSYHKVNAASLTKSGTQVGGEQKTRNSFVAVSAISPSKYSENKWRKNDIEDSSVDHSLRDIDDDDPTTQLLHSPKVLQANHRVHHMKMSGHDEKNETDPLENQLEELRQNNFEKRDPTTTSAHQPSDAVNSITITTEANITDEKKMRALENK